MARGTLENPCLLAVLILSLALGTARPQARFLRTKEVRPAVADGPRFVLERGGLLDLEEREGGPVLSLVAGRLQVLPAANPVAGRLILRTPELEVEAGGASAFSVEVVVAARQCNGIRTRIDVAEGSVLVRYRSKTLTLLDGQRWPRCEALDAATDR